jgi:hypothetical protein
MPSVSVRSMPWSSMTAPRGVSTPSRAYRSILPRWFTEVAQSITKGKGSDEGMPKVKGLWSDYDMSEALSSSIKSEVKVYKVDSLGTHHWLYSKRWSNRRTGIGASKSNAV